MLALVQRVANARVEIAGRIAGEIGAGLLVLVCAEPADDDTIADRLVPSSSSCASSRTTQAG
jgi:D-tyrosyl-tRNA(Tyr) deacylase